MRKIHKEPEVLLPQRKCQQKKLSSSSSTLLRKIIFLEKVYPVIVICHKTCNQYTQLLVNPQGELEVTLCRELQSHFWEKGAYAVKRWKILSNVCQQRKDQVSLRPMKKIKYNIHLIYQFYVVISAGASDIPHVSFVNNKIRLIISLPLSSSLIPLLQRVFDKLITFCDFCLRLCFQIIFLQFNLFTEKNILIQKRIFKREQIN